MFLTCAMRSDTRSASSSYFFIFSVSWARAAFSCFTSICAWLNFADKFSNCCELCELDSDSVFYKNITYNKHLVKLIDIHLYDAKLKCLIHFLNLPLSVFPVEVDECFQWHCYNLLKLVQTKSEFLKSFDHQNLNGDVHLKGVS